MQEQRLPCSTSANDGRISPSITETPPVTPTSGQHSKVCITSDYNECCYLNLHGINVVENQFILPIDYFKKRIDTALVLYINWFNSSVFLSEQCTHILGKKVILKRCNTCISNVTLAMKTLSIFIQHFSSICKKFY